MTVDLKDRHTSESIGREALLDPPAKGASTVLSEITITLAVDKQRRYTDEAVGIRRVRLATAGNPHADRSEAIREHLDGVLTGLGQHLQGARHALHTVFHQRPHHPAH